MRMPTLFLICLCPAPAFSAETTPAPLPADKAAQSMILPEGFRASVFASEPDVVQPIGYCIDQRGRLFVAEALNYGTWQPTGKDRIVILEDTDGDGRADKRTLFYEGFNYITGIEVGFGGVWVVSPPKIYFIPMRNGDDKPSGEPEVVFDGFGYKESRHNLVNGFNWGPDGWLYGGHGRTSPSDVGRPGTPAEQRIHCDGGVFRIHPTKRIFENFADGTTNPWGVDFDEFGQCFVSNCVNPHLFHMIQGGHYEPWRNRPSSLYAYERLPTCADHLHFPGGKPNEMRGETPETLAMGGGHAHCGTLIYQGDSVPAAYRNTVFMCNVHGRRINNDILKRTGSGYVAGHGKDFMISADPWFMGVTLRTGPDGSVFVSDWSDTGECHTYKPHVDNGRIFKISHGEPKKPAGDLGKLSNEELVKLQLHRNEFFVRHARRILQERAAKSDWKAAPTHAALHTMLDSRELESPQRLCALWALRVTGGLDEARLLALLEDRAEHVRAWAIQLLCEDNKPPSRAIGTFVRMAKDDHSAVVRLYLAAALQRLSLSDRWAIAEGLGAHEKDAGDANLPLMTWYGIEPLVPADPARALQLAESARIPLVRQYIARRVVDDAIARGAKGDLVPLVKSLARAPAPVQIDLLKGAREGMSGRKSMPMPEGWPAVYARLTGGNAVAREHAIVMALVFGDPQALADLRKTVLTTGNPAAERQAALQTLVNKRVTGLTPVLLDLLADRAVRQVALRGLASFPHEATPRRILDIYKDLTAEEKPDAVATLASRKEFALALLAAVENKTVARTDVSAYVARQLYSLGDKQVDARLKQVWGEVRQSGPEKQEQLKKLKTTLTSNYLKRADLSNGRLVFSQTCQQCHKLYGEGGTIGPDLTGSNRSDLDYLLSNLIDPSAEVARDYRMSIVETQNGRKVTGIVVERSPARLIMQTATERIVLAAEDVETIRDSDVSIMPEKQLDALTKEQVRDLIGYLAAKTQAPLPPKPKDKEDSDALQQLNQATRDAHAKMRAFALERSGPIVIAEFDRLILLHKQKRIEADVVPPLYHDLKAVAHSPLGVFLTLARMDANALSEADLADLKKLRGLLLDALQSVNDKQFSPKQLERQRQILSGCADFLARVMEAKKCPAEDLTAFARKIQPLFMENADDAARAQIEAYDAQLAKWRAELTAGEWGELRVIVYGAALPRKGNLAVQFFAKVLGQPGEGKRILYPESITDESKALRSLATYEIDGGAAAAFFDDPTRLYRDLLSDAAAKYLKENPNLKSLTPERK